MTDNSKNESGTSLKRKELFRAIKFGLFSVSAGIIEIGSYALFYDVFHWVEWVAYLVALVLSVIWNFTLNRKFTFKSANNVPLAMLLVAAFYAVFTPLSTLNEKWLTELGWNGYFVTLVNMLINFVTEFLYDKYVVFRGSIDTNDLAKNEKDND